MKPVVQKLADADEAKNKGSNVTVEAYPAASLADEDEDGQARWCDRDRPGHEGPAEVGEAGGGPDGRRREHVRDPRTEGQSEAHRQPLGLRCGCCDEVRIVCEDEPVRDGPGPCARRREDHARARCDRDDAGEARGRDHRRKDRCDIAAAPAYTLAPDKLSAVGIPAKDSFPVPIQLGELKDDSEGVPAFATFLKAATAERILQNAGFADAG